MVRRIAAIAPFFIVVIVLAGAMRLLAFLAGETFTPYNPDLEGARILAHRADLIEGDFPRGYDVLFAGTSRTMADFAADDIATDLGEACHAGRRIAGYNLGNVADSYQEFLARIRHIDRPRLLVLEFSPHVMLEDAPAAPPRANRLVRVYRRYRTNLAIFETMFAGWLKGQLGIAELIHLQPGQWQKLAQTMPRGDGRDLARLYYLLRVFQGYGTRIAEAGQVYYWTYFPNPAAAQLVDGAASEYDLYTSLLSAQPSDSAWRSFGEILDLFDAAHQIVVVRPAVSAPIYRLENAKQSELILRVTRYLRDRGIAYIDLNPNEYRSTDGSHIDWYDTKRVSQDLAARLSRFIRFRDLFGGDGSCPRPD